MLRSLWRSLLILPLTCTVGAAGVGEFTLEELLAGFAEVETVSADYREVRKLNILQEPLISSGTLCYRAPDILIKQVLEPREERVEIRGDRVQVIDTDGEITTLLLDEHAALRAFAESLRATLAGDRAALERYYRVQLTGDHDDWILRLVPRTDAAAMLVNSIVLRGAAARVHSIETLRTGGAHSTMTIEPHPS